LARKLARAYWDAVPAEERSAIMSERGKKPRTNSRLSEYLRCACGDHVARSGQEEEPHMPEAKEVGAGRMTDALY